MYWCAGSAALQGLGPRRFNNDGGGRFSSITGELSRQCIRQGAFFSVEDLKKAIRGFLDPWNENPKLFVWLWIRSWKRYRAAGRRSKRLNPAAPCHGAERRTKQWSSYFADTTLTRLRLRPSSMFQGNETRAKLDSFASTFGLQDF